MDKLFVFLESLTEYILLITPACCLLQMYLSTRKKWFWGLVLPIIFIAVNLYWITNPLPSWEIHHPKMTAMYIFLWFPPAVVLIVIFIVCRIFKIIKVRRTRT